MIGYLKGTISHLFAEHCFIEVQGIGYKVFIPLSTRDKLNTGAEIFLHTYLNVREDALILFGFYTVKEYELFMLLISVTGIGPKVAVNILSNIKPDEFYLSVSQKKIDFLTKIPGIGKKTAERIILELKDKINIENGENDIDIGGELLDKSSASFPSTVGQDAISALIALGYSQNEAAQSVRKIKGGKEEYSAQQLIKLALKDLAAR